MRYEETGSNYSNTVQWGYDDKNNLSSQTQTLNGYPALFDGVNTASWNARRYARDGRDATPMRLVWKHTQAEADDAFAFLRRMLALGADVQATGRENRSAYSGKTIRQHYEGSPVWELCGNLFG